ncbi:MAG: hypothetical protein WAZ12_03700 [Candidatus Absconditicoccaceae bacterium]
MSKIVFILGVSGSGKGTIIQELLKTQQLKYCPSYSTRPMRPGEINGDRYRFISDDEFHKAIDNDEFIEYATYSGHLYGTKKDIIQNIEGDKTPIKELELDGFSKIIESHQMDNKFISIFLDIPDEIMIQRITSRAPISPEDLKRRLERAHEEREKAKKLCNKIVFTDLSLKENVERVKSTLYEELNN